MKNFPPLVTELNELFANHVRGVLQLERSFTARGALPESDNIGNEAQFIIEDVTRTIGQATAKLATALLQLLLDYAALTFSEPRGLRLQLTPAPFLAKLAPDLRDLDLRNVWEQLATQYGDGKSVELCRIEAARCIWNVIAVMILDASPAGDLQFAYALLSKCLQISRDEEQNARSALLQLLRALNTFLSWNSNFPFDPAEALRKIYEPAPGPVQRELLPGILYFETNGIGARLRLAAAQAERLTVFLTAYNPPQDETPTPSDAE
jgi:hypothetical protein